MAPAESESRLHLDDSAVIRRRRFRVTTRPESVFDVMLALWSAFGADDKADTHEVGAEYFESFRESVPESTRHMMDEAGFLSGALWAPVLSFLAARAPSGTNDELLDWLAGVDDVIGQVLSEVALLADPEDVDAVIESRDPDALDRVLPTVKDHARSCLGKALDLPRDEAGSRLAAILRSIIDTAYAPNADEWSRAIAASAESTRRLEPTMQPNELIERITNGLEYEIPLGMRRLVAVPTVTLRPWTLITEFGDAVIVSYSVSDDHMDHDPDAAPGWLVRFHKALGDEKRLRILREVSAGGSSLTDLTDVIGLAKSTVFHHIGILRAAGLLRVRVSHGDDGSKSYELRREAFADADLQLHKYLEAVLGPEGGNE